MPPFFRELVLDPIRRGYFVLGVIAPDKLFCDFTNHYFNCTPTKSGRHYGKVHEKVEREVKLGNRVVCIEAAHRKEHER